MSPTGCGVILPGLISRISRMLKTEQSVSLHVESKDDKILVMGMGNPWVFLGVPVPIPAKTPTCGNG